MTLSPLESSLPNTSADAVIGGPSWAERYLPQNNAQVPMNSNIPENTLDSLPSGSELDMLLPRWAEVVDTEVNYFLQSYNLSKELESCINIIGTILKPRPKAKIRLEDDRECDREYLSISLIPSKNNLKNMADYIYNCNIAIARSLPASKLQYFVITME